MQSKAPDEASVKRPHPRAWLALAACALLLGACKPPGRGKPRLARTATPTHFLDEWFEVGDTRCSLSVVQRALTEPALHEKRVPEDLHVVDTGFRCEDASGAVRSPSDTLFTRARITYRDDQLREHAPARRTKLEQRASDHLAFEVAEASDGLPRPRTYDALTGDPLGSREQRRARVEVTQGAQRTVIAPWPRVHDLPFDQFVDRLVHTLTADVPFESLSITPEGHAALEHAAALGKRARERFGAQRLVLDELSVREGQPRLRLSLTDGRPERTPILSFEFELGVDASGGPTILRMLDPQGVAHALACSEERRELEAAADLARKEHGDRVRCNVLGTLLPARCDQIERGLLRTALRVGTRCGAPLSGLLDIHLGVAPPPDFSVTLQRGGGLLAGGHRFAVTVDRVGKVQLESQREGAAVGWLEGRTSEPLLHALHGELVALQWFERPSTSDGKRCNGDDKRGDILRVRAAGRERTVRDRDGCRDGFSERELDGLRRAIERVSAVEAWTAPFLAEGVGEAQIWVVAAD